MLERSEASKKPRNYHHSCRGGVGPPKKRREITKQQDLSCWNEVKHLKNRKIVIPAVGAGRPTQKTTQDNKTTGPLMLERSEPTVDARRG